MKWEFYNEDENTKEIQKDEIEEFELVLKQQIQNLSEISNNAIQRDFAFPDFQKYQKNQSKLDINEFFYDWYTLCYSALLCMESFRASRLNYLLQTLERINYSYHNSRLLEFAFNFRHFIEVSASYDKHVIEIIKLSEKVSNYPKGNLNLNFQQRKEKGMNLVDLNGDFIKNYLVPFYENTAKMMKKRIKDELNLSNSKINKISNTNFRVYFGPFDNLKSLKKAFDDISPLNFENIEIIKL